jgi:hypothetical protein
MTKMLGLPRKAGRRAGDRAAGRAGYGRASGQGGNGSGRRPAGGRHRAGGRCPLARAGGSLAGAARRASGGAPSPAKYRRRQEGLHPGKRGTVKRRALRSRRAVSSFSRHRHQAGPADKFQVRPAPGVGAAFRTGELGPLYSTLLCSDSPQPLHLGLALIEWC